MAVCTQAESDPDIELMLRVKSGDEEAFEQLSARYRQRLASFFYSLCWNRDSAQDYAQEVLLRVWLARERYEPSARLSTYIYRIARNRWCTELRSRKCRPEPLFLDEVWQPDVSQTDLESILIRRYEDRRIRAAIAGLPEHYRLVFVLSHFEGLKYTEIAEILEIPVGTVKSRMSSAVRMLREALASKSS